MKKGFSLIEILVSIAVLGLFMAGAMTVFTGAFSDWKRQRDYAESTENCRRALDLMSREIRSAESSSVSDDPEGGYTQILRFEFDSNPDKQQGASDEKRIYYWRDAAHVLWRSQVNKNQQIAAADQPNRRQMLASDIAGVTFTVFDEGLASSTVAIEITARPQAELPEGRGNRNFTLRTLTVPMN